MLRNISDYSTDTPLDDDSLFERIACGIEAEGYVILPTALPHQVADNLLHYLSLLEEERFHLARIGRGLDQTKNAFIRRDKIYWMENSHPNAAAWFDWTTRLKRYLNRRLFLGLFSFESHFALYTPGDFYKKHLDAFRGESNRVLTLVTYLNKGWEPDQGGELVLYAPDEGAEITKVVPTFGTLVIFLSEEFPHEVLAADRDRYSVAGWFRINGSINHQIDPPR
ncbi:MAG: 2OG-Fe(II) oxygenase [Sedimenticola sp.]|uniref:2OG-Fe(II) oxygenase n=1 Tax=Sedimenticola thiotaurini TaxID=1543721 RepID=A0A558DAJ5_9GAMM|nr:2OG-Fe(II) oxygenase [Sedimenticola sp.]TVT58018.1 MAG: 2OG-Fe(II) oxygenase [Sedimenticola thiotaurini]